MGLCMVWRTETVSLKTEEQDATFRRVGGWWYPQLELFLLNQCAICTTISDSLIPIIGTFGITTPYFALLLSCEGFAVMPAQSW